MKDETGTQYRMRKAEEAEKWRALEPEERLRELVRIQSGYPADSGQFWKIEGQISKCEKEIK